MAQMIGKVPFHAGQTDLRRYDCGDMGLPAAISRSACAPRYRAAAEAIIKAWCEPVRAAQALARRHWRCLAAGCSSRGSGNTNYSQFLHIAKESLSASFGNRRVTAKQAAAIPYASMGYSVDNGNQANP